MAERMYDEILKGVEIPKFYKYHQEFPLDGIKDPYHTVLDACNERGLAERIRPGMRVAMAVGSREYAFMPDIVRATADFLTSCGAKPFIVAAMGSHGGGTAEGQRAILQHLGVTEQTIGVPVYSQMETVCIGKTASGLDVHMDRLAYEADLVVPINRIKAHSDFHGRYESGLMKMLTVGLGKQHGASAFHSLGVSSMAQNLFEFGDTILKTGKIPFGVYVIENENHQICRAGAIPSECIEEEEPALLEYAKSRMPRFLFTQADLLVVDQVGKDFSGTGMDPNVIGRSLSYGVSAPNFERIVIYSLTEKSGGNAIGMGLADLSTERFLKQVDFDATYVNGITANNPDGGRMPFILPTERQAYCFGIKSCTRHADDPIRIVHIKNTMALKEMFISEGLAAQIEKGDNCWVDPEPYVPEFSEEGVFLGYVRCDG